MRKLSLRSLPPEFKPAAHLWLMIGLFYCSWAFSSYGNIYVQNLGFTASDLGIINAVCSFAAIFSCMIFGMISDRTNSIKKVVILCVMCTGVIYSLIPLLPVSHSYIFIMFLAYYSLNNMFKSSSGSLFEGMAVRTSNIKGINYGLVRSAGSIFYASSSLIIPIIISSFGLESTFLIHAIIHIPLLILLFTAYDPKMTHTIQQEKKKVSLAPLLKNYFYVTFLVSISLFFLANSAMMSFFPYLIADVGVSTDNMGTFLALRVCFEIPFLISVAKLRKKLKLKYLIMIGCSLYAVECFIVGFFVTGYSGLLFSSIFSGMGSGLFVGVVPFYLFKLAPDELKSSAQTFYTAVVSSASILGNLLGGYLFDVMGGKSFYILIGSVMLLAIFTFFTTLFLKKNSVNPADQMN